MDQSGDCFKRIERAFKRAVEVLREARIEFLLGGSLAAWVRGGPESCNDLDLMIRPGDADRAVAAFEQAGMRTERPIEGWLVKTWVDEVLIDLIFEPMGLSVEQAFPRAEECSAWAVPVLAMDPDDVLVSKLLALDEHTLDLEPPLQMARALREQLDWDAIRSRTDRSPYARAFFTLIDELEVTPRTRSQRSDRPRITVARTGGD
jgi:hypothetical protein